MYQTKRSRCFKDKLSNMASESEGTTDSEIFIFDPTSQYGSRRLRVDL